jgi:hypothetical protein
MAFIRIDTSRKTDINYICGSSGSGKSRFVKDAILNDARIIIFDPDDEYDELAGVKTCYSGAQLTELVKAHKTTPLRVRLVKEGVDAFELCCALAFAWTNCTLVCEEIADTTSAGKAPKNWGKVVRRGSRKRAIRIFAVTQRPAEADKTVLTQASIVRTGLLGNHNDRKAMALTLDLPLEMIEKLAPLDFVECHKNAKRSVFVGNAAAKTRLEVTQKVR